MLALASHPGERGWSQGHLQALEASAGSEGGRGSVRDAERGSGRRGGAAWAVC